MGSTSPAGSTGEDACHFSMAFTYELARTEYQVASDKLKKAVGPYKTARVCIRPVLRVYSSCLPLDVLTLLSSHGMVCAGCPHGSIFSAFAGNHRCPLLIPAPTFPPPLSWHLCQDAMTSAISSYTESMYEAGGGKGGSTGASNKNAPGNKKNAPGAPGQAKDNAPGAPGQATASPSEGQKWWEVLYKAQKKPTASAPAGAPAGAPGTSAPSGAPGTSARGRDGAQEQTSSRGRDAGQAGSVGTEWKVSRPDTSKQASVSTQWKVSHPVIKKDVDDAKSKEAVQQKVYKDTAKEREEQKAAQAKEVAAERKELLEEALKRIAAKEAKKKEEEKVAAHLKELQASRVHRSVTLSLSFIRCL